MKLFDRRPVRYFGRPSAKRSVFSLVRESPVASWTRVAWMTLTGADGQHRPGARFLGFSSNRRLCRRRSVKEKNMDILYERVAGLDVHKDTVVACVRQDPWRGAVRVDRR